MTGSSACQTQESQSLSMRVTSEGQSWLFDQTLYLTLDSDSRACAISAACSGGQLA